MAISNALIIGGGVIGLSIARELHRAGVSKITVLERGRLGGEASSAAAGMLAPNAENDADDVFYRLCAASCSLYPALAEELLAETGVDIELDQSGTLDVSFRDEDSRGLHERYSWQRLAGVAVERLSAADTLKAEPALSQAVRESLFYPNDWQVENRKLLAALRRYAEINALDVREHTEVRSFVEENGSIRGAYTEDETILADVTIAAAGAWTSLIAMGDAFLPVEVKPVRGQMICFHPAEKMFRKVIFSRRGYLVPRSDGRILIGSTVEDVGFDAAVTEEGTDRLRKAAAEIAPRLSGLKIADRWAGLRPYAAGGLPVLGEVPCFRDLYVAAGHYRNGILLAPLTAKLLANKIANGVSSPYFVIFGIGGNQLALDANG